MTVYKRFHIESSLNLENANQFSSVAARVAGMRDFSKELTFKIPKNLEKKLFIKRVWQENNITDRGIVIKWEKLSKLFFN